jgi:hypothetical protein
VREEAVVPHRKTISAEQSAELTLPSQRLICNLKAKRIRAARRSATSGPTHCPFWSNG